MHSLLFFVQAIVIAFCMVLSLALKYARIRFIVHICMSIILKRSRKGQSRFWFDAFTTHSWLSLMPFTKMNES